MAEVVTDVGFRLQINLTITKNTVREAPLLLKRVIDLGASVLSRAHRPRHGP